VISSFADPEAELVYRRKRSRRLPVEIQSVAHRKLLMIAAATDLRDLRSPPGNRLEELRGDRKGQYSIRINDQYRVCFRWDGKNAHDVEIVDYHRG
jgi:proteic killer suppression protein